MRIKKKTLEDWLSQPACRPHRRAHEHAQCVDAWGVQPRCWLVRASGPWRSGSDVSLSFIQVLRTEVHKLASVDAS